ncbi:class I SAM-dependent methyltransferase [Halorarum halophilum]|uniref:Class I SAM-dependent methyltransferase n=1 Tax=Halorarum halophilum TaxID=2743090 RepID=A0A7D5KKG4_9EURY|nr:class I SAM-dependent methyltransferase [Halobaculum halophilum]QLG26655.1 class I SAM-dependent methyltransferase [Halobaculum halophilum]
MDVPSTVTAALADRPVEGAVCLEAGAGVGNTSAGLLAAGADRVYAITNDVEHATVVRERVGRDDPDRIAVIEADLSSVPLADDSVGIITAHGLFNVLDPSVLEPVVAELTRVTAPGCHLVVDDYEPLPDGAAVADLFAVENAATQLAENRPALTFYPAPVLRRLLVGHGWEFERERTLLDPVPWTANHLEAHADVTRSAASELPDDLGERLTAEVERLATEIGGESAGRMYSLALRLPV